MCSQSDDPSQHDNPTTAEVIEGAKRVINAHIDAVIAKHHLAYVIREEARGPAGGKIFTYVCSCHGGYERKNFARHQAEMLKLP